MPFSGAKGRSFHVILLGITLLALALRLYGLHYDHDRWFHPDERRIAEAVMHLSFSPLQLNPDFFAYGSFPFYLSRIVLAVGGWFDQTFVNYGSAILVGRVFSALWGALSVALIGWVGRRLYGERVGLLGAGFLAVAVLHLQNSHFGCTDLFLSFLLLLTLTVGLLVLERPSLPRFACLGVLGGLAMATKFSAAPVFLPMGLLVLFAPRPKDWRTSHAQEVVKRIFVVGACVLAAFALGEPYAFLENKRFLHDIDEQSRMVREAGGLAFTNQYVGTPKYLYDLGELILWGLGPFLGITALLGLGSRIVHTWTKRDRRDGLILCLVLPFALIIGWFQVKFPRYWLPLYPWFCLWAAAWLLQEWNRRRAWLTGIVLVGTILYAAAFLRIYTRPFSMETASTWVYANIPEGSKLLVQEWDEGFPFEQGELRPGRYAITTINYYEQRRREDLPNVAKKAAESDCLIFQTKRLYGAISQAKERFPDTDRFFRMLFAGELGFELVHETASRPGLFGIELPTELADESFSVYDHPKALIFRNKAKLSAADIQQKVIAAEGRPVLSRRDLLLTGASDAVFGVVNGLGTRVGHSFGALILMILTLQVLGWVGWQVTGFWLGRREGVYALGKVVGVGLFVYGAWVGVATGLAFTQPLLLGVLAAMIGWALWARERPVVPRKELIATEAVFWGVFGFFVLIRALQPEIFWGEKPMDFGFLNAAYRATSLPLPETWFAGSALNYTYYGQFASAALGKLWMIDPAIQYNLAMATTAALAAAAALASGAWISRNWRTGVVTAFLVVLCGNLSGLALWIQRGKVNFDTFWATARVVPGTINEYPLWSFLFADLHAHVLAMPWALAFVPVWLSCVESSPAVPWWKRGGRGALAALLLGSILVTNGWSSPTYVLLALWLALISGCIQGNAMASIGRILAVPVLVGIALLLFSTFWNAYTPPPRQWGWEVGPYAGLWESVQIHGTWAMLVVPSIFLAVMERRKKPAFQILVVLLVISVVSWTALKTHKLALTDSVRNVAGLVGLLGLAVVLVRKLPDSKRLALALGSFACVIVAGCEVVFVWDRMNTLFKFYLDAWLLGSVAAGVLLGTLGDKVWKGQGAQWLWRGLIAVGLVGGVLTSGIAVRGLLKESRVRGPQGTLNGMSYLQTWNKDQAEVFRWMNQNISGLPTLLEAQGPGYQEYCRVSMNTGLPIVLGWEYHVSQRSQTERDIKKRLAAIHTIYTSGDKEEVREQLSEYQIAYVYLGGLERRTYNGANENNFDAWTDLLTPVKQSGEERLYAVGSVPRRSTVSVDRRVTPRVATGQPEVAPPAELAEPRGVAVDAKGEFWVADWNNHRIAHYDARMKWKSSFGKHGKAAGEFEQPGDVTVAPNGMLYVADTWNGRVQVFTPEGAPAMVSTESFFGPRGLAMAKDGTLFVADSGNKRVVRLNPLLMKEMTWGSLGTGPGQFSEPVGIAVSATGEVWVADSGNKRVQGFDRNGTLKHSFDVDGFQSVVYSEPHLVVDAKNRIWVTCPAVQEVRLYTVEGKLLKTWKGGPGGLFEKAMGIALLPDKGGVVVTDLTGRLAKIPSEP